MNVVDFINKYRKSLNRRADDITETVSSGSVRDMEQYRSLVGELQGVSFALSELNSLLKGFETDDEVDSP